jgi:F0F1-type ATP synthase epsilon subunit
MANTPSLTVIVRNRENILFNGQAQAISSVNEKGPFDVLAQHENFITLIKKKIVVHISSKENREFQIENGIAKVLNDKIFVYINFKV